MEDLNTQLAGKSFLAGFAPGDADLTAFEELVSVPDPAEHPHAYRWHCGMLQNLDSLRYSLQSAPTVLGGIAPAALPMSSSGSAPAGVGADLFPNCCPPTGGPIKLVDGLRQDAITKAGRADWYPPVSSGGFSGLMVNNTLTGDKQPFVPRKGRRVTWYTCGPTVYDSCHMGHARAYVTFDILRRVMTQYFGYDVFYQVNVTDVDDKIILRARRNKLLADYAAKKPDCGVLKKDLDAILPRLRAKAEGKVADMEEDLPEGATGMERTERKEQHAIAVMKLNNFNGMDAKVQAAIAAGCVDDILLAGKDALQEKLDEELGDTVTDHEVFAAHARKYEKEFLEDMEVLGVREPDLLTRVSEYVPQVVDLVNKIISNGFGYAANGSVYFDTIAFKGAGHGYPKNKGGGKDMEMSEAEMAEGEGALGGDAGEKKHKNDFALWKASKAGEPAWESPWGMGRPGWHIECSAMASDVIGENMDIHAGGYDLRFPHHDNELAQSEAAFCSHQWVNYFFHAGQLSIEGLKMSKSLKNFITIRQALQKYTPRQLRMMFLMQNWDKPMNFSDQTIDDATKKEKHFNNFFGAVKGELRKDWHLEAQDWDTPERTLSDHLHAGRTAVHKGLCDNFNTPAVVKSLVDLVTHGNTYFTECAAASDGAGRAPRAPLLKQVAMYVTEILKMLGVVGGADDVGFGSSSGEGGASKEDTVSPFVSAFVEFRDKIRGLAMANPKEYQAFLKECDLVRDEACVNIGVRVEDGLKDNPSLWKLDDPEAMRRELEEEAVKKAEKAADKVKNQIKTKQKDLDKWSALFRGGALIEPTKFFSDAPGADANFSKYDADGYPTHDKAGEAIVKSKLKGYQKEMKAHTTNLTKLTAELEKQKMAEGSDLVAALTAEIAALEASIAK